MTDIVWTGLGAAAAILVGGLAGWGLLTEIVPLASSPSAVHGGLCLAFAIGVGYLVFRGWMGLADEPSFRTKTVSRSAAEPRPNRPLKAAEVVYLKAAAMPAARQTVTLRIDPDVLDFFQKDGRGWQDRINATLCKAAGKPND